MASIFIHEFRILVTWTQTICQLWLCIVPLGDPWSSRLLGLQGADGLCHKASTWISWLRPLQENCTVLFQGDHCFHSFMHWWFSGGILTCSSQPWITTTLPANQIAAFLLPLDLYFTFPLPWLWTKLCMGVTVGTGNKTVELYYI